MLPGQPEHFGDVNLFLQPDETEPGQVTLGLWGPPKTLQMPYGTLRTNLCLPSELGLEGFDHLFSGPPLPMARRIRRADIERIRAALRARAATQEASGEPAAP